MSKTAVILAALSLSIAAPAMAEFGNHAKAKPDAYTRYQDCKKQLNFFTGRTEMTCDLIKR